MSAIVVSYVGTALRTPITENPMTELMKDPVSLVLMMVFGITLGPLSEELLFRGFLQPVLVRSLGVVPGIIVTAVPFGLLHFQQYGNSWRHALIVAMAGAGFGWMRHATGSTKASTVMHGSYNALFFAAELVRRYYEQR
jgi:membrane protease YdiL (CAAX protease family)